MRTLVLTGPGGAGSSTLAAAAAVRAAGSGRSTVLLTRRAPAVEGLADVPGLEVRVVDAGAAVERFWSGTVVPAAASAPQVALPPASSVTPLPGAADLALFAELGSVRADLVVVDAGTPEQTAALLALPATLRWWLDRLMPPGVRALGALRSAAVGTGAARRGPVDAALALVPELEALLAADRLADAAGTTVHLAAVPRAGTAASLRQSATAPGPARRAPGRRAGAGTARGRRRGVVARPDRRADRRADRARGAGAGAPHPRGGHRTRRRRRARRTPGRPRPCPRARSSPDR